MKFGQLIEFNMKIFFQEKHTQNVIKKLVTGFFLFFKKALYNVKVSGHSLTLNKFC